MPAARFDTCPAPQRVVAIVDPHAGRGLGRRLIARLRDGAFPHPILTPTGLELAPFHAAVAAARRHRAERLIVAGGDGTLMRVLTALLASGGPLPIATIPTGTSNIVAGSLHMPRRLGPALDLALNGTALHWWDVGHLTTTGHYFTLRASAGHDANTLTLVDPQAKARWRSMAYVVPMALELLRMAPVRFTVRVDEAPPVTLHGATAFIAVTNRVAGEIGFVWSNRMRPDDGVLYAGVFHPQKMLRQVPRLLQHMALEADNFDALVTLFPVRARVRIDCDPPELTQLDGELLGQTPLEATVVPRGIPFVVPDDHMLKTARFASLPAQAAR